MIDKGSVVEVVVRGYDEIIEKDDEMVLSRSDADIAFSPPYFSIEETTQ